MNKVFYSWLHVQGACLEIVRQVHASGFQPDYVVGITRGGLTPAVLISQYLGVKMETLKVSLRDSNGDSESNLWMAEDAFGYETLENGKGASVEAHRKNILIVDDINDTGATIRYIKHDWQSGCLPDNPAWDSVFGNNVRFATVVDNTASKETVDYAAYEINKAVNDQWIVFPWEEFWLLPN